MTGRGGCGTDELRVTGDAKVSIEDDTEQGAAAWFPIGAVQVAAIGELWVVGQHGADAGENGVGGVAEDVDLLARGGTGDPIGLIRKA